MTTVVARDTNDTFHIRSKFVLGCDGAKSQVRKWLGIASDGEDSCKKPLDRTSNFLPSGCLEDLGLLSPCLAFINADTCVFTDETMMTIHFNADLRPVVGERVGMLHWITDPACSGFIIAYNLSGNQVLISNFDSERLPLESWTEEIARETVRAAIGRDDVPFDVLSYRPWVLSRKVAKQYQVGNVFLCGDAAHSFPPTGGLGLNSGLADVHNIAYKIAAVFQGWARPRLLESYAEERRPVAMVNAAQSVKNGKKIFPFLKALGMARTKNIQEARENLLRNIHDPEKQQMIADEVEGQREHFDNVSARI